MNSKDEIIGFFKKNFELLNVDDYDFIYIYSDLRYFSKFLIFFASKNEFCDSIIDLLINKNKTVIMTTFTYTINGVFDVNSTMTSLGAA
jgi:hypothetical protein